MAIPSIEASRETHETHTRLPALQPLDFTLPPELEASEPPEARGRARDDVRLMVSYRAEDRVVHTGFREIGRYLRPGDLIVVNTSGTMNAALPATRQDGTTLELHLSTHLPGDIWSVELRLPGPHGSAPFRAGLAGEVLCLPAGGHATLLAPYATDRLHEAPIHPRLWLALVEVPGELPEYLAQHGYPIAYGYVKASWPNATYQTVYATEMGSAEMPSAGRPFTPTLITQLIAQGVQIAPLLLHTGVSSLEEHEPPYEEYYRVPEATARLVNGARTAGQQVVAVGTTVVRALETVAGEDGRVHGGEGWTRLVVTPQRGIHAVTALLTGLHEPRASHLAMLEALAGRPHLEHAYAEALRERYLWHEFGDLHLLLP